MSRSFPKNEYAFDLQNLKENLQALGLESDFHSCRVCKGGSPGEKPAVLFFLFLVMFTEGYKHQGGEEIWTSSGKYCA